MIDNETLTKAAKLTPPSKAVDFLAGNLDVYRRRNDDRIARLIWLIDAWSSGAGYRQIADIFEDSLGEYVSELEESFSLIGAQQSLIYVRKAVEACGGRVPSDEVERSELIEQNYKKLKAVDLELRDGVGEEAAQALLRYLSVKSVA